MDLFVSHRRLSRRVSGFPQATCRWALDSGGFSELSMYGRWETSPDEYVDAVRQYDEQLGGLEWVAPQDWMCEPDILAKTGLSVAEHQHRTIASVVDLRSRLTGITVAPVLQGWEASDYERCLSLYEEADLDLWGEPVVGLGSVCRRQSTTEIEALVVWLHSLGLDNLHGFGVKTTGLASYSWALASADSMAWSYRARRDDPLPGCPHQSCANCLDYALLWRERILDQPQQQLALGVAP